MQYLHLKDTDLDVSRICLGTAHFGEPHLQEEAFAIMDRFVEAGGNFMDTANCYGRWCEEKLNLSERHIGKWLKDRGMAGKVLIATKGAHHMWEARDGHRVREAAIRLDLEDSLRALGLETVDFYWLHRDDPTEPIENIMDVLEKLRVEGKIRYYGLSNYSAERLEAARAYLASQGLPGPFGAENQWSLALINPGKRPDQDPSLIEMTKEEYRWHTETGIAALPFTSTAMGFFSKLEAAGVTAENGQMTGGDLSKISEKLLNAYLNETNLRTYEKLLALRRESGYALQALSLAYFASVPFPAVPVTAVRNTEQLAESLTAADISLDPKLFADLWT